MAHEMYLYLPVETWVREFHAKVLFSVVAVRKGWNVVLGPKSTMHRRLSRLPEGTVLQFGLHRNFAPTIRAIREYGHKVVVIDEEGLVTLRPEHYLRYRVSREVVELCNACFCWGQAHYDMLKSVFENSNCALYSVGNPRMDLLRPELRRIMTDQVQGIREKHGHFILVNGNFGSYNHVMGIDYTMKSLENKGWMNTPQDADFHRRRIALQGSIFKAFHETIPVLGAAGHKVIVRPHPSENLGPWEELARKHTGTIKVVRQGNVVPWLLAARAILHNGCTTAVEAFVLEKPVISYRPEQVPELETELPNVVSMQAVDNNEILSILKNLHSRDADSRQSRMAYARRYVEALDGAMACDRIMDVLPRAKSTDLTRRVSNFRSKLDSFKTSARLCLARHLCSRQSGNYIDEKCASLNPQDVQRTVSSFARVLGMEDVPCTKTIGNGLIEIYGA